MREESGVSPCLGLRPNIFLQPTPNPSQEGESRGEATSAKLPSWEGLGVGYQKTLGTEKELL